MVEAVVDRAISIDRRVSVRVPRRKQSQVNFRYWVPLLDSLLPGIRAFNQFPAVTLRGPIE